MVTILDAEIINDSIYIEFDASVCDGSTREICLVDAKLIMESYLIRLSLKNEELCDANFTKKLAFDIKPV